VPRYNPSEIEPRWQRYWEENKTFRTPETVGDKKLYALDMFPYPSGEGLHVGHPEGYTATDIVARYSRMKGISVLHPMGFDAFGLPAEEYAIKTNTPPRVSTDKNIKTFTKQLKELGFSYDWDRAFATTDVPYVKWTQWIFLVLFDTWFDTETQKGRPISELPIPDDVAAGGEDAIREYRDDHRLAFQSDALVNWCPGLGTVLANEEVKDGLSERGDHPVERRPLRQWMLRITAYADRLEKELEPLDWSDGIKKLQCDWIGRSTGAEVDFFIGSEGDAEAWKSQRADSGLPRKPGDDVLRVYTTRPDTLFIAPEHAAVDALTTDDQKSAVQNYCKAAAAKSDRDRQDEKQTKTGVFTGSYAINPVNGKPIPIWIADYVLISYGTGAIMAVPGHDQRDYDFAKKYDIPIIPVVHPPENSDISAADVDLGKVCFADHGIAVNSGAYDGKTTSEVKKEIVAELTKNGLGQEAVNYKLRDWLFSRQRFWGEPFPILHEIDSDGNKTGKIRAVPVESLPVELPELEDYKHRAETSPDGEPKPPLERADENWLFPVIDGVKYRRETNTMPQWAGSCWYFLRFIDPHNNEQFLDPELEKQWMPVDLYIGGAEHAVLHLLYSRFWHKVLYDRGHVTTNEPFHKLVNQGMILGENEFTGYRDSDEQWISASKITENEEKKPVLKSDKSVEVRSVKVEADEVEKKGESFALVSDNSIRISAKAHKMSKSRGNVINPDEIIADQGADALRLYEMFMGPLTQAIPWSSNGVKGIKGFLDRVWRMIVDDRAEEVVLNSTVGDHEPTEEQNRVLHKTIKAVTADIEKLSFNTAIARMMEFTNFFTQQEQRPKVAMEQFVLLLSPFAPHLAEELWALLGNMQTLAYEPWPEFDEGAMVESSIEIPVQIMGKNRAKINVPPGLSKDDLLKAAMENERIQELLEGKTIRKEIVVPDRLVNIVAN